MKRLACALTACVLLLSIACTKEKHVGPAAGEKWIGLHLLNYSTDSALQALARQLPRLADRGVNMLFLEVDYSYEFQSHPELRMKQFITRAGAQQFGKACREAGIRLIIQFQSLGHQSWAKETFPLLTVYPELDVTPGAFPNNDSLYCREWDPTNPKVNEIVFPLIDEIVDGFGVDGVHLGMDEVFLLSSDSAPNTKDKNPAELFAKVVNEFHDHLAPKKVEMFIWADRLIDGTKYQYGEWESSLNGTAPAVDMIPKDVVLCDWHYEPMKEYGSVDFFLQKGFKVMPCSWRDVTAVDSLINYSFKTGNPNMVGHLFTTWHRLEPDSISTYKPMVKGIEKIKALKGV
jgi:hypothetical protein